MNPIEIYNTLEHILGDKKILLIPENVIKNRLLLNEFESISPSYTYLNKTPNNFNTILINYNTGLMSSFHGQRFIGYSSLFLVNCITKKYIILVNYKPIQSIAFRTVVNYLLEKTDPNPREYHYHH